MVIQIGTGTEDLGQLLMMLLEMRRQREKDEGINRELKMKEEEAKFNMTLNMAKARGLKPGDPEYEALFKSRHPEMYAGIVDVGKGDEKKSFLEKANAWIKKTATNILSPDAKQKGFNFLSERPTVDPITRRPITQEEREFTESPLALQDMSTSLQGVPTVDWNTGSPVTEQDVSGYAYGQDETAFSRLQGNLQTEQNMDPAYWENQGQNNELIQLLMKLRNR